MTYVLIITGVIAALLISVLVIGYLLPVKHVAGVRAVLDCSVERLWRRLTEFSEYPDWRRGLKQVTRVNDDTWNETDQSGDSISYQSVEILPKRRFVRRIANKDLPFGGTWTIELAELGPKKTRVNISEAGEIYNPVFRFVSRFITGRHGSMSAFMEDLAKTESTNVHIEKC